MRHILLLAIIPALLGAAGLAMAQSSEVRTDQGPKGSNITPGPGRPPGSTPGGATPTNPGGLAKNPHDVPAVPYTEGGLPRALGGKPKPASESAGKADTDGLHGRARKGTGGGTIDRPESRTPKGANIKPALISPFGM